jgi:hypothetical protein
MNCKLRIDISAATHRKKTSAKFKFRPLTALHCQTIKETHTTLYAFYEVSISSEGCGDDISGYIQHIDFLHREISTVHSFLQDKADQLKGEDKARHGEYKQLAAAAQRSWEVVEKYVKACDDSSAYYAAMVLNPAVKWIKCEQESLPHEVKKDWLEMVTPIVDTLWLEFYKNGGYLINRANKHTPLDARLIRHQASEHWPYVFALASACPRNQSAFVNTKEVLDKRKAECSDDDDELMKELYEFKKIRTHNANIDAYQQYLGQPLEHPDTDPLDYWNMRYNAAVSQGSQGLDLCRFALDMLAMPSMSAKCERVFSLGKLIVTDRRNRIKSDIIEACECLRYWYAAEANDSQTGEEQLDRELLDDDEPYISELQLADDVDMADEE